MLPALCMTNDRCLVEQSAGECALSLAIALQLHPSRVQRDVSVCAPQVMPCEASTDDPSLKCALLERRILLFPIFANLHLALSD